MSAPSTFPAEIRDEVAAAGARPAGLLKGRRRYLALAVLVLIAAPMLVGFIHPDSAAEVLHEGRRLAPWPGLPRSGAEWLKLPSAVDAYLRDHFGMRSAMIRAHKDLTKPMLGAGDAAVLVGRDGRMFYLGEEAVRQSAGLVMRDERIAETVSLIAAMREELARRNIRFLVASPPNASTVYQEDLPYWAQNKGRRTEYDAYLAGLRARGVRAVDLRPVMAEARKAGAAYYRHDTHWAPRGALAAYDAIVAADGHSDWRVDPGQALTAPETRKGGDLARLLGVQDGVTEKAEDFEAPPPPKELLTANPYGDYVETFGGPGPTIMVIGDSFTGGHFTPLLAGHASKVIWLDHQHCGFDWTAMDRFHPDEVWWMPNERFLMCGAGEKPQNFPKAP